MATSTASFDHSSNSGVQICQLPGKLEYHNHHGPSEASRNEACLRDLRITNPRDDKTRIEDTKGGLLQDSFRWVLSNEEFIKWRNNRDGNPNDRLLWIRADPGKGKTMLLCGIIDELATAMPANSVISYFFCQESDHRLDNAVAVLRGLVFLLAEKKPALLSHIRPRYDREGRDLFEDRNAFEALSEIFLKILKDDSLQSTILIVDALDECIRDRLRLLELIQRSTANPGVKWVVSSRNWPIIEKYLTPSDCSALSLELNDKAVADAVRRYILAKVNFLARHTHYQDHTRDFAQGYLMSNSNHTFLWAALVCDKLTHTDDWEVKDILTTYPASLDALYRRMMQDIQKSEKKVLCQEVLVTICTAYRPLMIEELSLLADPPLHNSADFQMITHIVKLCGSFLTLRENTIFFVHHSAKEFLRKSDQLSSAALRAKHCMMMCCSVEVMNLTLRRNICHIQHPASQVKQVQSSALGSLGRVRYACLYWIDHLLSYDSYKKAELSDGGPVQVFLEEKLLYWLEALSLLRSLSGALLGLLKLETFLQKKCPQSLSKLVGDVCRFIRHHRAAIETCPLQIYSSALIFSPRKSLVKSCYQTERASWIVREPVMPESWSPCLHVLESEHRPVCIDWSRDGMRVLSLTTNLSVISWDARTRNCISTLILEKDPIYDRAFLGSFNNNRIAAVCSGPMIEDERGFEKIFIWDLTTGKCVRTIEEREPERYSSGIFWSGDGRQIASQSTTKEVKIWGLNGTADRCILDRKTCYNPELRGISRDGSCLLLKSSSTVMIYNRATGVKEAYFSSSSSGWPLSLAWSHDTTVLASTTDRYPIEVWKSETGELQQILKGHSDRTISMAWSCDGNHLASGELDGNILIWNIQSGICHQRLEENGESIDQLLWDPYGNRLASLSRWTIRIWSTSPGLVNSTEPHISNRFSLCAAKILSFWNSLSPRAIPNLIKVPPRGPVTSVFCSPDGKRIASMHYDDVTGRDKNITGVWDINTGSHICTFVNTVGEPVWSQGENIAILSESTIHVWNVVSGQQLFEISHIIHDPTRDPTHGHSPKNHYYFLPFHNIRRKGVIAWSPDGCQIAASCCWLVEIWDSITRECLKKLEHAGPVEALSWSHDGHRLASSSKLDGTVRVWDLATEQYIQFNQPLNPGQSAQEPWHLLWSCDNARIASGDYYLIVIHDSTTGVHLGTLEYHEMIQRTDWYQGPDQLARTYENNGLFDIWDSLIAYFPQTAKSSICSVMLNMLDRNQLHTSLGIFNLESIYRKREGANEKRPLLQIGYGISEDFSWITWKDENLLYLPWDYRPRSIHAFGVSGTRVTIGCYSGRVLVLSLADNPIY